MQQYYLIVSRLHGMALEVQGNNRNPGAQVVPFHKTGNENQLWYDDHATGTVMSKLNGFCLDIEGHLHTFCPADTVLLLLLCASVLINRLIN